jgi:hypothetical protein
VTEGYGIWLPIPKGRAHDDALTPVERAIVDALTDSLGRDRLRLVLGELLSFAEFTAELDSLMLDLEERRLDDEERRLDDEGL